MAVIPMIGHNRFEPFMPPDNDETKQVIIAPWRKLLDCLREIPAHFLWSHISNEKLFGCCREPENLELEIRKTQDIPMREPDLYVMKCGCGRMHRRLLVDPAHFGDPAKAPEPKLRNPFYKG
jgi:hypothetical protein